MIGAGAPAPDLAWASFPCQDLSAANPSGLGLDGARSGLAREFVRIIIGKTQERSKDRAWEITALPFPGATCDRRGVGFGI